MLIHPNTHNPLTDSWRSLRQRIGSARHIFIPTRLPDSEYVLTRLAVEKIKGMDAQTVVYVNMSGSYITRARILDGMAGKKCDLVENATIALAAYARQTDACEKTGAEKKQEFTAQMASFKLLGSDDVLASGNESQVISIQTVRLSHSDEDVAADISELVMRAIENEIPLRARMTCITCLSQFSE